jgi:hypothetical protein
VDKTINITVVNKVAIADGTIYICDNSDFLVEFEFDREWDAYEYKTARFLHGNDHTDVLFGGNICRVPILTDINNFKIGVFAGDLSTSTPAVVYAKKSILSGSGYPAPPSADVYNQILAILNGIDTPSEEEIVEIIEEYLAEHPSGGGGEIATDEEVLDLLKDAE